VREQKRDKQEMLTKGISANKKIMFQLFGWVGERGIGFMKEFQTHMHKSSSNNFNIKEYSFFGTTDWSTSCSSLAET
jgi:hypothetical protein